VGEDQSSHVELTREVARRFNHLYGREPNFEELARNVVKKLGKDAARAFEAARKTFQEEGGEDALQKARALVAASPSLGAADRERLDAWIRGTGKTLLREPQALHTEVLKLPGLDGTKMSKSYGNAIAMREEPAEVTKKIRRMPTDPARVHRSDPGNPEKCPVWQFHLVYSDNKTREWVQKGCKSAGIGCLECKQPVIDAVLKEQEPMRERAQGYLDDPTLVRNIIEDGCDRARKMAAETMRDVREAMGLGYT
jgi:tryptophanyl-tRNA synthetase